MSEEKKKEYKIIINGTEHTVTERGRDLRRSSLRSPFQAIRTIPDIVFSVTFEKAESKPHQGTLAAGGTVTVKKHGTVFDVTQTNRS